RPIARRIAQRAAPRVRSRNQTASVADLHIRFARRANALRGKRPPRARSAFASACRETLRPVRIAAPEFFAPLPLLHRSTKSDNKDRDNQRLRTRAFRPSPAPISPAPEHAKAAVRASTPY